MRLVLFGPPGVGKGTQGARLANELSIPQLAMGDILRQAVAEGSELGRKAKRYMDAGQLLPDDIVIEVIESRILSPEAQRGFLLDGFPRNVAQAAALDRMLEGHGMRLDRVIFMDAPESVLIRRLSGRLICEACGLVFNRYSSPPRTPGRCDRCGGRLIQREDDREEVIANRLAVYRKQTQPLLEYYGTHPGFHRLDASGGQDEVYATLKTLVVG